ncbi:hypothetical protein DVU_2957 [Nitratidesulfovibrio vulgaris str. Hildenborough]|uniref:Uncharacterized protein n=1 Tax=Nitratidesulfovibrio vulgaris (strain ATCC 29579 / DSM 644 / CCUG 34227 / NCIMB 8303 / VKM B-1760 / Hildenborough) TaxID=882 RepID=Q726Z9_NITV2|nr:hypothetical protein DVU_2957 [Nitratidesulfovibrio vulgaris str. Hildenborough]
MLFYGLLSLQCGRPVHGEEITGGMGTASPCWLFHLCFNVSKEDNTV